MSGCGDRETTEERPEITAPLPASDPPPPDEPKYDGLTLAEWRGRIHQIHFDDPAAADAVPGLTEIVRDRDVTWHTRRQAALTLGRIGEPARAAVPVLVELLHENTDAEAEGETTQFWAIKALALFGPVANEATPLLVDILRSESRSHHTRLATLEALGRIGTADSRTLPAIIETLQLPPVEEDDAEADRQERRIAAAEVLELFRGHAAPAVPALMLASADESVVLRRAAVKTLGAIGPPAEPALPTLVDRLLFDDSEDVRDLAARAMAGVGPSAEPYLRQLLQDAETGVRWRAADALANMSRHDEATLDALKTGLTDESTRVRLLAAEALWNATGDSADIIGTIVAELGASDRVLRLQAVQLLERIGPTPEFGRTELQQLMESGDAAPRQAAGRVLRHWDEQFVGDSPVPGSDPG